MMENSQGEMVIIQSSWSVGDVNQFHAEFDVKNKMEIFIYMRMKKLYINEHIEAVIVSEMTTRNLGYIERHGDSCT